MTSLRVLITTKIFPNAKNPGWAPFNRQQFAALARLPGVEIVDVLATLPWFPGVGLAYFRGRSLAQSLTGVPAREVIDGLPVRHPRTLYLPRVDGGLSGALHLASLLPLLPAYRGRVDVILSAWAYPDGCAAVALGRLLGVPVVVKLHGSDINVLGQRPGPRRVLQALLPRAARVVSVSAALGREVQSLGVAPERIDLVRNGVDGALFHPRPRDEARAALGLATADPVAVCVSRLEEDKGVLDLLEAFAQARGSAAADERLRRATLVVIGGGKAEARCQALAASPALRGAVRLTGPQKLAEIPRYLAAADVAVMPSWAEGLPNTILEAHACGRAVVATDVGGVGEVVDRPELGVLVPPRDPAALGAALAAALCAAPAVEDPARAAAIAGARATTWPASAAALLRSLRTAAGQETRA